MRKPDELHVVAVTAIIVKDGKYLIVRRASTEKRWPEKWSVPGGRLEMSDYVNLPKETHSQWYSVLEKVVKREVKEEVNLEIEIKDYVTSIATVFPEGTPLLIISFMADYVSGEVILAEEELDQYKWVTLEEAREYDFIEGVYDELELVDRKLRE